MLGSLPSGLNADGGAGSDSSTVARLGRTTRAEVDPDLVDGRAVAGRRLRTADGPAELGPARWVARPVRTTALDTEDRISPSLGRGTGALPLAIASLPTLRAEAFLATGHTTLHGGLTFGSPGGSRFMDDTVSCDSGTLDWSLVARPRWSCSGVCATAATLRSASSASACREGTGRRSVPPCSPPSSAPVGSACGARQRAGPTRSAGSEMIAGCVCRAGLRGPAGAVGGMARCLCTGLPLWRSDLT
mmetsp:Transcript_7934/g.19557  ORF Transcript_7934/g.19557 Transcript_7934/m.19557 type:complete len:246 (-) Transcript_7934:2883-3620(-)